MSEPYSVLFLCTGNSARSILAEAIMNRHGAPNFRAYSAGSFPKGTLHPAALELLNGAGYPTGDLRSKSWTEFASADAAPIDFIFTVCDNAAGESCPVWPGKPITAHWGIPDPAAVEGDRQPLAFWNAYVQLQRRIELFLALPLKSIDHMTLANRLREIGATDDAEVVSE